MPNQIVTWLQPQQCEKTSIWPRFSAANADHQQRAECVTVDIDFANRSLYRAQSHNDWQYSLIK